MPSTLLEPPADWRGPNLATREERLGALAAIAAEIDGCRACGLCHGRNKTVPGDGDPLSPLVFVGEGPGADEDQSGIPFVGRAGQLLTKMIEAMGYQRSEVFILNIVKCRPPGNRAPLPEEMDACLPYLRRQLDVIRPRVMVCLGATAVGALFPEHAKTGITKLRGQWLKFGPADAMPTYHPSYLLRNPAAKRPVWEDLQQVMKVFGKGGK
ncbi:MAG: uracil-DNA glycosylase [Candidatus Sumerlaeia bacterium]|nr:uracil-DNA glycosylase [Candidatus Sumerlaeia bacterium]